MAMEGLCWPMDRFGLVLVLRPAKGPSAWPSPVAFVSSPHIQGRNDAGGADVQALFPEVLTSLVSLGLRSLLLPSLTVAA